MGSPEARTGGERGEKELCDRSSSLSSRALSRAGNGLARGLPMLGDATANETPTLKDVRVARAHLLRFAPETAGRRYRFGKKGVLARKGARFRSL